MSQMTRRARTTRTAAIAQDNGPPKNATFIPKFKHLEKFHVTFLPNGWGVSILQIDPDLATDMLQRNSERQRHARALHIEKMAGDMESGDWMLTHQGLAFDQEGILIDGQNRLQAVITSGATSEMLVFFGVGKAKETDEAEVIDTHAVRNMADAAMVAGIHTNKREVACVTAMIRFGVPNGGQIVRRLTNTMRVEALIENKEAVSMVESWIGGGRVAVSLCKAPVTAAFACAYYHVNDATLKRFIEVFTDQATLEPGESGAKMLRHFIQLKTGKLPHGSETFLKTCKAIQLFIEKKDVKAGHLFACQENPFPMPKIPVLPEGALARANAADELTRTHKHR